MHCNSLEIGDMGIEKKIEELMDARRLNDGELSRELYKLNRSREPERRFIKPAVSLSNVRRWHKEDCKLPGLREAVLLAEFFGISVDELVGVLFGSGVAPARGEALTPDEKTILDVFRSYGRSTRKMISLMAQADSIVAQAQADAAREKSSPAPPFELPHGQISGRDADPEREDQGRGKGRVG